jgi:hypothetical protein
MKPDVSASNRTPSSTAFESPSGPDAVVDDAFQMVHGQVGGVGGGPLVVKDQLKSLVMALPASSLTPAGPPLTVAVYLVPEASAEIGISVLVGVSPPACADAGTRFPSGSRNSNVVAFTVDAFIIALNVAVTTVVGATPVASRGGVIEFTVTGVAPAATAGADARTNNMAASLPPTDARSFIDTRHLSL